MSFEKWFEEYEKSSHETWDKTQKEKPGLIREGYDGKILQCYLAYKQFQATKWLVIATWVLAIASIILSILTLYSN